PIFISRGPPFWLRKVLSFDGPQHHTMQILQGTAGLWLCRHDRRAEFYSDGLRPLVEMPGSSLSRCAWKHRLESSGKPLNSIPMPTPGSRVRTVAVADV